jgi:transposase InsO family protein
VFLVLAHEWRRILYFAVTAHPTAEWTAQQTREAFPWDTAPRYLLRDRDRIFGQEFVKQVKVMGIKQVLSAPRSPWQRAYVERVIGTIRRECLDHLIVFNEPRLSPSFHRNSSDQRDAVQRSQYRASPSTTNSVVHFSPDAISEMDSTLYEGAFIGVGGQNGTVPDPYPAGINYGYFARLLSGTCANQLGLMDAKSPTENWWEPEAV